ncbi:chemotaxis protein CheC [Liquorilactobacillus vini]|uniref:Chemotaxis protein CheC n=1 Tax=Liquorilactobacillus vini DSM 20605 TaxID=1133569 RepID=A0A0A7RGT6_9LACO|nr:chemotaxis protein CheC [Liquorilactobacillus vini]AJA34477.1 chemotaxis protein CheC [Liquorilactobacillus vini DSM 20605]KRM88622.1 chemotaxis protein CheC [Liquorilactobacillus vini DSM 20605]
MKYTDLQIDGLREIINIGGGNAATSISKMVSQKIDMKVPEVKILTYSELYQKILADDVEVYAVISRIIGKYAGAILFIVTNEAVDQLSSLILGNADQQEQQVKLSAISELSNIVSNSFLNAIGKVINAQLISSLPQITNDFFGAIISSAYMAFDNYDEQVMVIRNEFSYSKQKLDASLFLIPEEGVLDKMIESLGI